MTRRVALVNGGIGGIGTAVCTIQKDLLDKLVAGIPIGRLAQPAAIAALVAFLTSEEAGYITGANIAINGGMCMT